MMSGAPGLVRRRAARSRLKNGLRMTEEKYNAPDHPESFQSPLTAAAGGECMRSGPMDSLAPKPKTNAITRGASPIGIEFPLPFFEDACGFAHYRTSAPQNRARRPMGAHRQRHPCRRPYCHRLERAGGRRDVERHRLGPRFPVEKCNLQLHLIDAQIL